MQQEEAGTLISTVPHAQPPSVRTGAVAIPVEDPVANAVKPESPPKSSLLKKALVATLVVAVPGGTLLGLAYLIAKKRKTKAVTEEPPKAA